jgi:hypothetical protein
MQQNACGAYAVAVVAPISLGPHSQAPQPTFQCGTLRTTLCGPTPPAQTARDILSSYRTRRCPSGKFRSGRRDGAASARSGHSHRLSDWCERGPVCFRCTTSSGGLRLEQCIYQGAATRYFQGGPQTGPPYVTFLRMGLWPGDSAFLAWTSCWLSGNRGKAGIPSRSTILRSQYLRAFRVHSRCSAETGC